MYFGCLLSYVHMFVNVFFHNICMYGYTDHATVPQSFKFLIRTYISGIYKRIFKPGACRPHAWFLRIVLFANVGMLACVCVRVCVCVCVCVCVSAPEAINN